MWLRNTIVRHRLLQEEAATDTDLYDQLAECLTSLMKRYRVTFLPVMDQLMPGVLPMLAEGAGKHHADTADERRFALCLFDDIIEHCNEGGAAHRYLESFLPHVLRCCGHKDADVRQAAVYGLGVVAQHGGDAVAPHVPQVRNPPTPACCLRCPMGVCLCVRLLSGVSQTSKEISTTEGSLGLPVLKMKAGGGG